LDYSFLKRSCSFIKTAILIKLYFNNKAVLYNETAAKKFIQRIVPGSKLFREV